MMTGERNSAFVKALVERFPGLSGLFREHIGDNCGAILPHVFFGDLTRYLLALHAAASAGDTGSRGALRAILDFLEDSFSTGDRETQDLIAVSFLENLPAPGADGSELRSLLGRGLSAELARMDGA